MMLRVILLIFVAVFSQLGACEIDSTSTTDERIVGGIEADIEDFPYQVSLHYRGRHFCGGSILSSKLIVTAAHCTHGVNASFLTVHVGSASHKSGGEIYDVEGIDQHPEYDSKIIDYDISMLKLKTDLKLSQAVNFVELSDKVIGPNHFALVSGWGTMKEGGQIPEILRQVYVPLMSDGDCRKFYGKNKITDRMICAGYTEGGHDSCQGDSGGPLVYKNRLIGIVSWGIGCARANYPGVYTSVNKVRSYLKSFFL